MAHQLLKKRLSRYSPGRKKSGHVPYSKYFWTVSVHIYTVNGKFVESTQFPTGKAIIHLDALLWFQYHTTNVNMYRTPTMPATVPYAFIPANVSCANQSPSPPLMHASTSRSRPNHTWTALTRAGGREGGSEASFLLALYFRWWYAPTMGWRRNKTTVIVPMNVCPWGSFS